MNENIHSECEPIDINEKFKRAILVGGQNHSDKQYLVKMITKDKKVSILDVYDKSGTMDADTLHKTLETALKADLSGIKPVEELPEVTVDDFDSTESNIIIDSLEIIPYEDKERVAEVLAEMIKPFELPDPAALANTQVLCVSDMLEYSNTNPIRVPENSKKNFKRKKYFWE